MGILSSQPDAGRDSQQAKGGLFLKLRRLIEDRRGVGAIEFAIVAPALIMGYIGAFEISVAITMARKVNRASSTISDLLTQSNSTNIATLDSMKDVASNVIAPFTLPATDRYSLKITGIAVAADGTATVAWSRDQKAGKPYATGSSVTLPSTLEANSTFIVRTELTVPHEVFLMLPSLATDLKEIDLAKTSYFRQRTGTKIDCTDC